MELSAAAAEVTNKEAGELFTRVVGLFVEAGIVQLRDVSRIFSASSISWDKIRVHDEVTAILFSTLCCLFVSHPSVFYRIRQEAIDDNEFTKFARPIVRSSDPHLGNLTIQYVNAFLKSVTTSEEREIHGAVRFPVREKRETLKALAERISSAH